MNTNASCSILEQKETLNQIASKYELLPRNLINWKQQFLENMSLAFDKSSVVKEFKEENETLKIDCDKLAKKVGHLTIEKEFLEGKLVSSVSLNNRKKMLETGLKLSKNNQLKLLSISKSSIYYRTVRKFGKPKDIKLLNKIDDLHVEFPYYGYQRLWKQLRRENFKIGRKRVISACKYMGILAIYPKPKLTIANKEHEKYKYLLKIYKNNKNQIIITEPNEVWSTDITYIKVDGGMVYLAAIIDWGTKKILSWKLSNTMDISLTTSILNEALVKFPVPKIVNTDQGSQYTAKAHINILKSHNIKISMNSAGRSTDNICIERFWRSLKYEDIYLNDYSNISDLKNGISKYIEKYNTKRLHSTIGYITPNEAYYKNDMVENVG